MPGGVEVRDDPVERIRSADAHASANPEVAARAGRYEHHVDRAVFTLGVVAPQVARISMGLVDVGVGGSRLALELDDDDALAQQENGVRPT